MVDRQWDALVEIIHRIRQAEDELRESQNIEGSLAMMRARWIVQDVLEESEWSKGYIG